MLRVGIDKTYGALSPVFADMTFKYIPIYHQDKREIERNETRTYYDLKLARFLPPHVRDRKVHLDPEFDSFTYGDPGRLKRASLLKLTEDDLLVFYIGGKAVERGGEEGCFIIGYFVVASVVDWNAMSASEQRSLRIAFAKNAHIVSSKSKTDLVLVKGSNQSKLLPRCIPITERNKKTSNPPYVTLPGVQKSLGIRSFIVRAVPIWIHDSKHLDNLKLLLGIDK